ncbi:hypothetical protein VTJ49DRAFT_192 [Mycothermus thermophilus]|uniref:Uncharacterized protein n=1 Tax=Humicola insolens TaxID=85995 RepID=A0ABR3VG76_HUMIN
MKPFTFLVSALAATFAVAAPAAAPAPEAAVTKDVEARSFNFDITLLNGLKNFNQVNLNYLLNINAVQIHLLQNLATVNNFNVLQFQSLFQRQAFDVQGLLHLQALHTFLQFHQLGLFNGFDLSGLNVNLLNLGLLNNVGVINLQDFILPNVIPQVQNVASQRE